MYLRDEDRSYFENREFKKTLHSYEEALEKNQSIYMDADEFTDIAEYYMVNNQEQKALDAINLAVQLHPNSIDPQVFLARHEMFRNNLKKAYEICDAIPEQKDNEVLYLRAELLIREEKLKAAETVLEEGLGMAEEPEQFMYDSTVIFMDYMLWKQAERWCNRLKKECPSYPGLESLEAEILVVTARYDEAKILLNAMLDQNPYNSRAWHMLAESHCSTEAYEEAIEACEYALAIDERDFRALSLIANAYYHRGEYEVAHEYFTKALKEESDDVLHHMDAICLFQMGNFEEASDHLKIAGQMIINDENKKIYVAMQRALVEARLHNMDKAVRILEQVKKSINDRQLKHDFEVLYGQVLLENDALRRARNHFKKAFECTTDPEKTAVVIGLVFFEKGYYAEAVDMLASVADNPETEMSDYMLPYLAMCYRNLEIDDEYLLHLRLASIEVPELTEHLFKDIYPGVSPIEYPIYAFKEIYGTFPPGLDPSTDS